MKNRQKVLPQGAIRALHTWRLRETEVGSRTLDYLLLAFRGTLLATAPPTTRRAILFEEGSSGLDGRARSALRDQSAVLRANPGIRVVIGGFASQPRFTASGMGLALRRVQAIRAFVLSHGVGAARIDVAIRGPEWFLVERPRRAAEEDPFGLCLLHIADSQWALWKN